MTKRPLNARHRAAPTTGSLEVLSKAVASNAGTMGRQAAVIAAAGGLVVTLGVSGSTAASHGQQAQAAKKADAKTTTFERTAAKTVVANAAAKTKQAALPVVKVKTAPAPEAVTTEQASTGYVETSTDATESTAKATTATSAASTTAASTSTTAASTSTKKAAATETASTQSASTSTESSDEASSASSVSGSGLAATAESYLGAPYVLGGNTPAGWDCSGFVRWVYKQNGKNITARTARAIWTGGQFKKTSNPKPGDIIIQRGGAHIAIYMGGGRYIGAQNPSVGTTWRDLSTTYDSFNGYYTWAG